MLPRHNGPVLLGLLLSLPFWLFVLWLLWFLGVV